MTRDTPAKMVADNPQADQQANHEHDDAHDALLADLLERAIEAAKTGKQPDFRDLAGGREDLASELRSLWTAALVADCVAAGHSGSFGAPAATADEPGSSGEDRPGRGAGADLPRQLGDFELVKELGRGGMGIVYKARQKSLGRTVALKVVLRGELASPGELARFRSEVDAVARLDHPNIVPVLEAGEHGGQPYFTMRYVSGTTLTTRLADGPIPARDAAELLAPVARAIHYAHERGILHRDLKPSNILIDREGKPHVTDFGLAMRVESDQHLTASGAILGTPAHMAPEQAAGARGRVGPTSDVYSLGTILYQMLTGRPPFQAAPPVDTVLLVLEQEPLPPRLLNPRADRQLEMIALKCLQKPPDLRYATAAALADDLEAYLADEPIAAQSGLLRQIVDRWFRETHHATVLENWGLLWMLHSLALLVICLVTNWFQWRGLTSPVPYVVLWTAGLGTWAAVFWTLRHRAGPVTFIERQIAHVWAASMASIALLFVVEIVLGLPVLTLSPVLALTSGMVFLVKAGMLSGQFYVQSAALFATALAMAWLQQRGIRVGITLFGVVSAACFFFPGLKYYRQSRRAD